MFEVNVQNELSFNWAVMTFWLGFLSSQHQCVCSVSYYEWNHLPSETHDHPLAFFYLFIFFSSLQIWLHDDNMITCQDIYNTAKAIKEFFPIELKWNWNRFKTMTFLLTQNTKIQSWNVTKLESKVVKSNNTFSKSAKVIETKLIFNLMASVTFSVPALCAKRISQRNSFYSFLQWYLKTH